MRILHRDDHVLAVDKPAGVLTVPGRPKPADGGRREDEPSAVPLSLQAKAIAEGALPVHRLDRFTSGVVLFALTPDAHRALSMSFESRRAEKVYLALCRGDLADAVTCSLPLIEQRRGGVRVAQPAEKGAQPSETHLVPLERFGAFTWVLARPRTGRMHQIRVHLAALGHPLAVDPRYGDGRPLRAAELSAGTSVTIAPGAQVAEASPAVTPGSQVEQASAVVAPPPAVEEIVLGRTPLHAASIRVPHPSGRGWLSVESPLPADLLLCLDLLRAARRRR